MLCTKAAYRRIPTPGGMKKNVMFLSMKSALSPKLCSFKTPKESKARTSSMLITLAGKENGRAKEMMSPTRHIPKMSASCIRYLM